MKIIKNILLSIVVFLGMSASIQAAEVVNKSWFSAVAIDGKDSVTYHNLKKNAPSQTGTKKFVVKYKGANWRFFNAEHAAKFKASPAAFAPQYNGFCANALSLGEGLVKTDGTQWWIAKDKLYLFYSKQGKERWQDDGAWQAYKVKADSAWDKLKNS